MKTTAPPRPPATARAPRATGGRTYLAGTVYEALRRDIVEREFVPGEPLTEQELSRRYGVSRTPVREALAKLEILGFTARFRELEARGAKATPEAVRALGEEFHAAVLKRAGNARLVEALEEIREQIRPVWTMAVVAPRRVQGLVREHLAILDALTRADARRAERLMAQHVRRVRDTIFRLLD
jgi:DNA-binding GntR family transcriptional regulator